MTIASNAIDKSKCATENYNRVQTLLCALFPDVLSQGRPGCYRADVSSVEKDVTLIIPASGVSVNIPRAAKRKPYFGHASTDFSNCLESIPEDHCITSPLVEVDELQIQAPVGATASSSEENSLKSMSECITQESPKQLFTLFIPHYIKKEENRKHIQVRKLKKPHKVHKLLKIDKSFTESEGYWVEEKNIVVRTRSFSIFCCTIHKEHCDGVLKVFLFGNLVPWEGETTRVDLKFFMCSSLYDLEAFQQVTKVMFFT